MDEKTRLKQLEEMKNLTREVSESADFLKRLAEHDAMAAASMKKYDDAKKQLFHNAKQDFIALVALGIVIGLSSGIVYIIIQLAKWWVSK